MGFVILITEAVDTSSWESRRQRSAFLKIQKKSPCSLHHSPWSSQFRDEQFKLSVLEFESLDDRLTRAFEVVDLIPGWSLLGFDSTNPSKYHLLFHFSKSYLLCRNPKMFQNSHRESYLCNKALLDHLFKSCPHACICVNHSVTCWIILDLNLSEVQKLKWLMLLWSRRLR